MTCAQVQPSARLSAKRRERSRALRENFAKQQPRGNVRMDSAIDCGRYMQKLQRGRRRRAALYHLFCPLFNSPMCALKHRLHMPSLASRPAAKGCPAAHRFSISNKNRAPRHFCGASAGSVCLHGMPGIIPSLTAFFALGWPKSEGRSLRARDSLTPLAPAQQRPLHAPPYLV